MMDKKTLKERQAYYRAWNEDKFMRQVLQSARMTAKERWEAYQDLYDFVFRTRRRRASYFEQVYVMNEWKEYLDRIQRFEQKKRQHGKTA